MIYLRQVSGQLFFLFICNLHKITIVTKPILNYLFACVYIIAIVTQTDAKLYLHYAFILYSSGCVCVSLNKNKE